MDATESPRASTVAALLAGLESGIVGVFWMLAWLGVSAAWQQRSFWTAENLMATAFYGPRAIHSGFASATVSGLALYLMLYGLLGAGFAALVQDRFTRSRTVLVAMLFSLGWYYLTFHLLWRSLLPLVALLHVERTTAFGHVIYGLILGMFPGKLRSGSGQPESGLPPDLPAEEPTPSPLQSSSDPDPASRSENS
jgi:hypothetical protein